MPLSGAHSAPMTKKSANKDTRVSGTASLRPADSTSPTNSTTSSTRAIAPEAEGIAVGVNQIREGLEHRPLLLVMRLVEAARISSLAGRFDLDEANEGVSAGHGVIRPCLEIRKRGLAHHDNGALRQPGDHGRSLDESLQWRTQLVLGRTEPQQGCCFALCLVESPRVFVGVFRRRIARDDGAIREPVGAGGVVFPMNRCCRSGEDVVARAPSVGKRWGSVSFSRACPHGP